MHFRGYPLLCLMLCAATVSTSLRAQSLGSDDTTADRSATDSSAETAASAPVPVAGGAAGLSEVTVTARKTEESILNVPISLTALSEGSLEGLNVRSFDDTLLQVPNLGFAYGTTGLGFGASRTVAIRGISGEGTTAVYIDDTPVPDSLDPRVVDIERVEVLKGPQGTLFGQSSLGGTVRFITVQPSANNPDVHYEVRGGGTEGGGSADYGANFAGSHAFADGALTARVVAFGDHSAGFITRSYPNASGQTVDVNNQGAADAWGGSLTVVWQPTQPFSATLMMMYQRQTYYGWPTAYAPLPAFKIVSLTVPSPANVQENVDDHWYLPALTLRYSAEAFSIVSSISYFDRTTSHLEDDSNGTQFAFDFDGYLPAVSPTQAFPWYDYARQLGFTNENRITFNENHGFSGIAGTYYSRQYDNDWDYGFTLPGLAPYTSFPGYCPNGEATCPTYNSNLVWFSAYPTYRTYEALFGEAYYNWNQLQFTLGLRAYRDLQSEMTLDDGAVEAEYDFNNLGSTQQTGVVPKAAITFKFDPTAMVYVSAAEGFRAGGVSQPLPPFCGNVSSLGLTTGKPSTYKSDSVWNYELGGKTQFDGGRFLVTAALFQMNWSQIQQSYIVPICYLGVTLNEGAARARGGELEISAQPWDEFQFHLGFGYNDSRISVQGLPSLPPVGTRVPIIPEVTGTFSATYTRPINGRMSAFVSGDANYVGNSLSYTDTITYPVTRPAYTIVNASFGVRWNNSELSIYGANLGNEHPNLGDLYATGFVAHTSVSATAPILPRVATLQPLNAGLQYRQHF